VDAEELVSVCSVNDPAKAEIIKNALVAEGIPCRLGGEHQAGLAGIFQIDVLVRAADADRARAIIQSHGE
jgi:hypothetical protein